MAVMRKTTRLKKYRGITSMQIKKSCKPVWNFPSLGSTPNAHNTAIPTPCHQVANTIALKLMNFASGCIG